MVGVAATEFEAILDVGIGNRLARLAGEGGGAG